MALDDIIIQLREQLDDALRTVQRFGVWGGRSERERRNMRRSLGITTPHGGKRPRAA